MSGIDVAPLASTFARWKADLDALQGARTSQADLELERERLAWQLGEVDKLDPGTDEWQDLNAEHGRLANAQALIEAAQQALALVSEDETSADALAGRAAERSTLWRRTIRALAEVSAVLQSAQAQLLATQWLHETRTTKSQTL